MKKLFFLAMVIAGCTPAKYPEPRVNCIKNCMSDNTCSIRMEQAICRNGNPCLKLVARDVSNKWEKCEEVCK